jgi:hypothetical protein
MNDRIKYFFISCEIFVVLVFVFTLCVGQI